jgi:hypothetical protein
VKMWNGFNWLGIGYNGEIFKYSCCEPPGSITGGEFLDFWAIISFSIMTLFHKGMSWLKHNHRLDTVHDYSRLAFR